jgi:hypothetical protein
MVLLGIEASSPETEYGWIEPAWPHGPVGSVQVFRIRRFWEKPSPSRAGALFSNGCLWNSFVMAGRVSGFIKLIEAGAPDLVMASEVVALFYRLIESAKLCNVEPKAYLLHATHAARTNPGTVTPPHDLLTTVGFAAVALNWARSNLRNSSARFHCAVNQVAGEPVMNQGRGSPSSLVCQRFRAAGEGGDPRRQLGRFDRLGGELLIAGRHSCRSVP